MGFHTRTQHPPAVDVGIWRRRKSYELRMEEKDRERLGKIKTFKQQGQEGAPIMCTMSVPNPGSLEIERSPEEGKRQ